MYRLESVFKRQKNIARCVPFLRQRLRDRQLGTMVGAGISLDAGVPSWGGLVREVRSLVNEPSNHLSQLSNDTDATFLTEISIRRFKEANRSSLKPEDERFNEHILHALWLDAVKVKLYQNVDDDKIKAHPYLKELSQVINSCHFNISFNFDNILDRSVADYAATINAPLPSTTNSLPPITRRYGSTIFHINGLMPREVGRKATDLIFSEDAFARVLTDQDSRRREYFLNQLSEKTFVLCGLSMKDRSLSNMLKASQTRSPGCFHFYINYVKDMNALTDEEMSDIFNANLHVYNLVTLFLDSDGIRDFLRAISDLRPGLADVQMASVGAKPRYVYYIVGSPAAGKTTLLENLRSFQTIEEWTQPLPDVMLKKYSLLTRTEQDVVDQFLDMELIRKDNSITANSMGITFIDRAPLDLFAFSSDQAENLRKSRDITSKIFNAIDSFSDGHVIFLEADADELAIRQAKRGKATTDMTYTGEDLVKQSLKLKEIYSPDTRQIFNNTHKTPFDNALRVARHILFEEYRPTSMRDTMQRVIDSGGRIGLGLG